MRTRAIILAAAFAALASPLAAQQLASDQDKAGTAAAPESTTVAEKSSAALFVQPITIQHFRPQDQRGLFIFEAPKHDAVPYQGFHLAWGAAFTQQFQGLNHSNTAAPKITNGVDANQLIGIGSGFNNAAANLNLNIQFAPGMRIALTTYLSAKHHQEAWVKDGYILIDESPIKVAALQDIMKYVTLRIGHFEVNYGDAHFRRSDNGNTVYNPFVGNLIMDAFTTEIGGEVYVRSAGFLAMGGVTGGEIHGEVTQPGKRSPAFLGKIGYDRQINPSLRARLTGSVFTQQKSMNNTLYSGDRAGSRYNLVLENTAATTTANAWSGNLNPGFRNTVTSYMVNPFVKLHGLELFGTYERATGSATGEPADRTWSQYAGDAVYRFLPGEKLFVAARYNVAQGTLTGIANDVSVNRVQLGGGWFVTPTLLLKGEYVNQKYNDFPTSDIRSGGRFHGFMMEGAFSF